MCSPGANAVVAREQAQSGETGFDTNFSTSRVRRRRQEHDPRNFQKSKNSYVGKDRNPRPRLSPAFVRHQATNRRLTSDKCLLRLPYPFDKPTTGLAPNARRCLCDLIESINRDEKRTVILVTRSVEEAGALCDRIAIINHGKIAALDTPTELTRTLLAIMDRSRANALALTDITPVTVKLENVLLSRTGKGPRASPMQKLYLASLKIIFRGKRALFWALLFPLIFTVVFSLFTPPQEERARWRSPLINRARHRTPSSTGWHQLRR